jgi:hypothetical protein
MEWARWVYILDPAGFVQVYIANSSGRSAAQVPRGQGPSECPRRTRAKAEIEASWTFLYTMDSTGNASIFRITGSKAVGAPG